ncbi:MAG: flagellar motor switch protein FliN [Anaerolineaceae bacterium]|nr:flagellar motor switch protein FliN [Anaerolineaceae bacterium]
MSEQPNQTINTELPARKPQMSIDLLMDIPLKVSVELGRTRMTLHQALELQPGSVIELDRLAGDPVDIFVNEKLFACGEVVVVADKFAVRITELVATNGASAPQGGM